MHTGSHFGAENIAFMFSLFESCKLNDINFGDYMEDILTRLMEGEQDFMSLIPCNYNSNKKVNVKAAWLAALAIPINNMFFWKMLDVLTAENQ